MTIYDRKTQQIQTAVLNSWRKNAAERYARQSAADAAAAKQAVIARYPPQVAAAYLLAVGRKKLTTF